MLIKVRTYHPIRRLILIRFTSPIVGVSLFIVILFGLVIWIDQTCHTKETSVSSRFPQHIYDLEKLNRINEAKRCFQPAINDRLPNFKLLEDVFEAETTPQPDNGIFFHETSCSKDGMIRLNAR